MESASAAASGPINPLGMVQHLHRLTRPVAGLAPGAHAVAIYSEPQDGAFVERGAPGEGVACVDDAARAAILYALLWRAHGYPWARDRAEGLLSFVRGMQTEDGSFANFIWNWEGERNLTGLTSAPHDGPWTARAMHALGVGAAVFGSAECREGFERGLGWIGRETPHMDLRAVELCAAVDFWRLTRSDAIAQNSLKWADEIAATRSGDVLLNQAGVDDVHLWGHLQELALVEAGVAFGQPGLVEVARRSADAMLVPAVRKSFPGARMLPFDVSCAVRGLDAVAVASGDAAYAEAGELGRDWFLGRNSAHAPVYGARHGVVHDGIDDGRVNLNSGAEANIEGPLALIPGLNLAHPR